MNDSAEYSAFVPVPPTGAAEGHACARCRGR
jgi:hypothetical protein